MHKTHTVGLFTWTNREGAVIPLCAAHRDRPVLLKHRDGNVVVICEEAPGFWHLLASCSQEQFVSEREKAAALFASDG